MVNKKVAGAGHRSPSLLAALLLRAALPPALLAATSHASSLPEDPLDTDAFLADVGVSTEGVPLCAFGNGTRTTPLPTGFFGPEPCVFESGMVLRANDPLGGKGAAAGALVWGFSKPGAMVSCAVGGAPPVTATADGKGRWELTLQQKGSPAPRTLVFSTPGSTAVSLTNVLFGDVWLCSGQSNMDFSVAHWGGGGCLDANETVAAAASGKLDDIRLKKTTSSSGIMGSWFNSSAAAGQLVGSFSAVCYLTAMQIKKNIPGYTDRYGTFRLNFHRFDRFELDLRGHTQP